jgi:hypothetical protein
MEIVNCGEIFLLYLLVLPAIIIDTARIFPAFQRTVVTADLPSLTADYIGKGAVAGDGPGIMQCPYHRSRLLR